MPRKAKEKNDEIEKIEEKNEVKKKSVAKKTATKKASTDKKTTTTKKATAKKTEPKETTDSKKTTTRTKKVEKKEPAEKATAKKATTKKAEKKSAETKETKTKATKVSKATSSKKDTKTTKSASKATTVKSKKATKTETTAKPKTTRKRTTKKAAKVEEPVTPIIEYYDLPYKYGNTVVRLLAQTPKTLFVYWEVSDTDIENFKNLYGEDFFNKTRPVLIVHNLTLNKTNEIEINDFANCWYLNTEDTDCKYDIELARKFVDNSSDSTEDNYLYIAKSNTLQSPNNHILFEKIQEFVVFRNASNDNIIKKNIKSFKFLRDIYKFYRDMYDEDILNNPSSQFKF